MNKLTDFILFIIREVLHLLCASNNTPESLLCMFEFGLIIPSKTIPGQLKYGHYNHLRYNLFPSGEVGTFYAAR